MEPYRSAGLTCPSCPGAPLREFQDRYICDECQGILIGTADFASAVADLIGETPELEYRDEEPTTQLCPLCEVPMRSCLAKLVARVKTVKVKDRFLRCERHGLWCGDGVLAGVFALAQRRWIQPSMPEGIGMTALDGLPYRTHGSATAGLRISQRNNRPRARAKTLSPINAYRDHRLACPTCAAGELRFYGDRYGCETCAGAFVENAALAAMVADMVNQPWELPAIAGTAGERACPVCRAALIVEVLEGVTIDRCGEHGVWFDQAELAAALAHATGELDGGVRGWLGRLFA
jgi:hypothetical protein